MVPVAFRRHAVAMASITLVFTLTASQAAGEENPELARVSDLNTRFSEMYAAGRYEEAIPLATEALAIREKLLGPDHPDTAKSLNNLGVLYDTMGDYAKAEPLYERSLAIREKTLGPDDPAIATALNNLGMLEKAMGHYAEAKQRYERALAINQKALGPEHPDTATCLDNLGELYRQIGQYKEAESVCQRALAIREKALGPECVETAMSLNALAVLYTAIGEYAKAEPLYQRALTIQEKLRGSEHPNLAPILNNLASLYQSTAKYAEAKSFFERALRIAENAMGPKHPETAISLNNLASLYDSMGEYEKAEPLYLRALAIREKIFGHDHPITASSLGNLAALHESMGNYSKAEPLYEEALAIWEKTLGPDHPDTAIGLNNLAALHEKKGEYAKAELLLKRSLAIREKVFGPDKEETAGGLNNLAALYKEIGNYAKAEPLYLRALDIRQRALGKDHPETAASLENLALLYGATGDYAKSEQGLKRALAIRESALGPEHPDTVASLNDLGELYDSIGAHEKAEALLKRALSIRTKALGPEHPDLATSLNNLAGAYSSICDFAQAEPLYRKALAITEKAFGPDSPQTAGSVQNLAFLELDLGHAAEALRLSWRAEEASEKTLANILSFSSEQQRMRFQSTQHPYMLPPTLGDAPLIARTLLRWKGVVLDSILEDRAVARRAGEKGFGDLLEAVKGLQAELMKLTFDTPRDASATALAVRTDRREAIRSELEKMEAELAKNVGALGRSREALEVTPEQVQMTLAPREVLVETIRYRHYIGKNQTQLRYGAVVFAARGELEWVSLGSADEIEKLIRLYQKSARMKTNATTLESSLRGLYAKLWASVEKVIPRDTESVILSPDAQLNFVSFATLLGEDNRFLAERYSLRYVSSGRDLLRIFPQEARFVMNPVALYGNPDFRLSPAEAPPSPAQPTGALTAARESEIHDFGDIQLPPLGGTAAECEALGNLARDFGRAVAIHIGAEATEASLRRLQSPWVLHLATHGFFLPEMELGASGSRLGRAEAIPRAKLVNPMHRSGLGLAGAQTTLEAWGRGEAPPPDNDGILTAEEVGTLNLADTWLVTLSACETGSGEARAGEGVLGLRRGFIQAGAQNLLMTLWPISDETTVQIMLEFYGKAFAIGNAPVSLNEVQRKWLVELRKKKGLLAAVNLAGPFIMSSQGKP